MSQYIVVQHSILQNCIVPDMMTLKIVDIKGRKESDVSQSFRHPFFQIKKREDRSRETCGKK